MPSWGVGQGVKWQERMIWWIDLHICGGACRFSVRQPAASAIAAGVKDIENRTRSLLPRTWWSRPRPFHQSGTDCASASSGRVPLSVAIDDPSLSVAALGSNLPLPTGISFNLSTSTTANVPLAAFADVVHSSVSAPVGLTTGTTGSACPVASVSNPPVVAACLYSWKVLGHPPGAPFQPVEPYSWLGQRRADAETVPSPVLPYSWAVQH